jgi:hypothetical protein
MSWSRTVCLHLLAWLPAVALAACAEPNPPSGPAFGRFRSPDFHPPRNLDAEAAASSRRLRGTAQVISVDPAAGSVVLNLNGQHVMAYWQLETTYAQVLTGTQLDPQVPPAGDYLRPQAVVHSFPAKPGDTIAFLGVQTGASIFLQGVSVLAH